MLPKLQAQFEKIEVQRIKLLKRLANVDGHLWKVSPSPSGHQQPISVLGRLQARLWKLPQVVGDWSFCEIIHHLVLAEKEMLRQIRYQDVARQEPNLRDWLGATAVRMAFQYGWRVRVPLASVVPEASLCYEETCAAWDKVRVELAAYLAEVTPQSCNKPIVRHPVAGRLNIEQTLDLLIYHHVNHHLRQVANNEKALGILSISELQS
jgi:hypothetical protein